MLHMLYVEHFDNEKLLHKNYKKPTIKLANIKLHLTWCDILYAHHVLVYQAGEFAPHDKTRKINMKMVTILAQKIIAWIQ